MADNPEAAGGAPPHATPPVMIQLTEEEKSVLLECRRNSLARGFPAGVGACLALRWLIKLDRVPLHIQRWQWFYYAGTFMVAFLSGVASYKQRCIDKIMALENSQLANQARARRSGIQSWDEELATTPPERQPGRHRRYPPRHQHEPRPSHAPSLSSKGKGVREKDYSTAPEPVYPQADQRSDDFTSILPQDDQPDAFSGSSGPTTPQPTQKGRSSLEATPTRPKGRTFDEIRDENRQRQLHQSYPRARKDEGEPRAVQDWRQQGTQDSGKPVRRNKYGDVIEE